jgi:hypothetical protein
VAGDVAARLEDRVSGAGWLDRWLASAPSRLADLDAGWQQTRVLREEPLPPSSAPAADAHCALLQGGHGEIFEQAVEFEPGREEFDAIRIDFHPARTAEPGTERPSALAPRLLLAEVSLDAGRSDRRLEVRGRITDSDSNLLFPPKSASLRDGDPGTWRTIVDTSSFDNSSAFLFLERPTSERESDALRLVFRSRPTPLSADVVACIHSSRGFSDLIRLPNALRELAAEGSLAASPQPRITARRIVALSRQPRVLDVLDDLAFDLGGMPTAEARVMQQAPEPRQTRIFERGDPHLPGATVQPRTPAALPPMPSDAPRNRLGLARWIVSQENPLAARVAVNRWWGLLLGAPLVRTPEDFGIRGARPTHPELLDWLAVELMESGWSRKHLLRSILLTDSYRQSTRPQEPGAIDADPQNLLLARANHRRLSAEAIRDNMLKVSGLLVEKRGGPSVYPPQPIDAWQATNGAFEPYIASVGPEIYRRSLYMIRKRSSPPPNLLLFGSGDRSACRVSRDQSNTPLQALALLNEEVFASAAFALAARILDGSPDDSDRERLRWAFVTVVSRLPSPEESAVLEEMLDRRRERFARSPGTAKKMIAASRWAGARDYDPATLASWSGVARVLLNLSEARYAG